MTAPVTLDAFLNQRQADPDLSRLLGQIATACCQISQALARGALAGILGNAGTENVQGEGQKKLDVIANDLVNAALLEGGLCAAVASEEMDDLLPGQSGAPFLVLHDPLDGSSNIDVNMSVGTIFSVLRSPATDQGQIPQVTDFLQAGRQQIAAGYALYGPSTLLVLTVGQGVHCFTLDPQSGTFVLTAEALQIPPQTAEFAINMSNQRHWQQPVQDYIRDCMAGSSGPRGKNFNMRWVASMVGDVHRILTRGGIFLYPYDRRDPAKPGKLRLMYEANPMSLLVEQAGGQSINGNLAILDIAPTQLHQRVAVILGSGEEVSQLAAAHQQAGEAGQVPV